MTRAFTGGYERREIWLRGLLRQSMREALVSLTGDAHASMRWSVKGYHKKIYTQYGLELVGWPDSIVFTNLSEVTGYTVISMLYVRWQLGEMKFERVALGREARAARKPEDVAPGILNRGIRPSLGRSDLKK
ncbi:hypothetical protein OH77DRAFT_1402853, partial [Trametes cingulata]